MLQVTFTGNRHGIAPIPDTTGQYPEGKESLAGHLPSLGWLLDCTTQPRIVSPASFRTASLLAPVSS